MKDIHAKVMRLAGIVGWNAKWLPADGVERAEKAARLLSEAAAILEQLKAEGGMQAPLQCRECLEEFSELTDGLCENCNREPCDACDGTGYSDKYTTRDGAEDCDQCGGDGVI